MCSRIAKIGLTAVLVLSFCVLGFTEDKGTKKEVKAAKAQKEVTGEVSGISKDSIAVVYKKDSVKGEEYEISFPIDKTTRLTGVNDLKKIKLGDTVAVVYEDLDETDETGQGITKRKGIGIRFVRTAPVSTTKAEESEEEER